MTRAASKGPALALAAVCLLASTSAAQAQSIRGRVGLSAQSVSFQSWQSDGSTRMVTGVPVVSSIDISSWGFGVEGLSAHVRARLSGDVGSDDVWPTTEPLFHLVEGYFEYAVPLVTARVGRTHHHSRLGYSSFDGARLDARPGDGALRLTAFGGWSLARGSTLPITDERLDPLGEFRPGERGFVAGAEASASVGPVRATVLYHRETEEEAAKLTSEFVAFDAGIELGRVLTLAGGADYDLALAEWGTAEVQLGLASTLDERPITAQVRLRRYVPRFDLWTIWSAFSPSAYTESSVGAGFNPLDGLQIRGRGSWYEYEDSHSASPLVPLESDGWSWSAGARLSRLPGWVFDADFGADFGPGASTTYLRFAGARRLSENARIGVWASRGTRPLELRIDDAVVRAAGVDVDLTLARGTRLEVGAAYFDEERAGGSAREFDHWRVRAGISYGFGAGADRPAMHPAIMAMPEAPDS